ncbi:hypothetical protein [uncultured Polaribacter sp.]|uniref:hypothetical protein n=1 Tax=uncultured Polaribacter sp. TaxID=174711 RepID=UPI00262CF6A3|nr:hypothetical protein [uncultured Polaribacter sp.]
MKKLFKFIGLFFLLLIIVGGIYYFINNEPLPQGKKGKEADALAIKMLNALHHETYENTEILEWSFRGSNFYKWQKNEDIATVSWDNNKVVLHTKQPNLSEVFVNAKKVKNPKLIKKATNYFNNDSFWLVAPYKVFDKDTERRLVKHDGKDALLVTYTSGGSTPGDSYLWILDENYFPIAYKMWTKIIPIGGVSATWSDWKKTDAGIQLPTKHMLSLFGIEISMGDVKAYNQNADDLANKILKAVKHKAYKNTRYLEWSFADKRHFKWDKEKHIVDVSWDSVKVNLHPANIKNSTVYFNSVKQENPSQKIIKKAWNIFNNDSFWLVAPHKLFDDGVVRNIINIDDKDALQVTYTSGGTTPGDAYVWILDTNYIPKSYKMYLKNGRITGTPATWEDWITTKSGTLLPTNHTLGKGKQLSMGTVKAYN